MSEIGKTIDKLRLEAGYESLGQLHKASGVTIATLSRIINNIQKPGPATLKKLAPCLGVSHEFLLNIAGHIESNSQFTQSTNEKTPKDLINFLEQSEVLFDGILLTKEDKEKIKAALEIIFWDAKQEKKRKKS